MKECTNPRGSDLRVACKFEWDNYGRLFSRADSKTAFNIILGLTALTFACCYEELLIHVFMHGQLYTAVNSNPREL